MFFCFSVEVYNYPALGFELSETERPHTQGPPTTSSDRVGFLEGPSGGLSQVTEGQRRAERVPRSPAVGEGGRVSVCPATCTNYLLIFDMTMILSK